MSDHQQQSSLSTVTPQHHAMCLQNLIEQSNLGLYITYYFGHCLQIDQNRLHREQNENFVMYGLTYILPHDGYLGKTVPGTGSVMIQ